MHTPTTHAAHPPLGDLAARGGNSGESTPSRAEQFMSRALRRSHRTTTITTVVPSGPASTAGGSTAPPTSSAQRAANAEAANRAAACDSARRVRELVQAVDATYAVDYHRDAHDVAKAAFLELLDDHSRLREGTLPELGGTTTNSPRRTSPSAEVLSTTPGNSGAPIQPPPSAPLDLFVVDDAQARKMERTRRRLSHRSDDGDGEGHGSGVGGGRPKSKESASHRTQLEELVYHSEVGKQRAADLLSRVSDLDNILHHRCAPEPATSAASTSKGSGTSVASPKAAGASWQSEFGLKQLRQAVDSVGRAARSVYEAIDGTVEQLGVLEAWVEARDVSIGPVEAMLRLAKEELLFARQQRDEAKRELMLHRVCAKFRANAKRGREQRGEEYTLVSATQPMPMRASIGGVAGRAASLLVSPPQRGLLEPSAGGSMPLLDSGVETGAAVGGGGHSTSGAAGNVRNPHSAVAGLTPALRLQGAAMARNAFRTVPPRKGASAGDVERAEAELTHCIANVDVIFATCVNVCIADYDLLWHAAPFVMQQAVRVFNRVVDEVAARFDKTCALVYRSRGSVAFAPHGGYHLIVFRHPHEAVRFSAMLHCALLLAPWPQQLVEPQRDGTDDGVAADAAASSQRYHRESDATRCAASTVYYDPSSMATTVVNNRDNGVMPHSMRHAPSDSPPTEQWGALSSSSQHQHFPVGRSPRDMLVKELEQFQMRHDLAIPTAAVMEYGEALSVAERLCAHVAIGPARVHALFAQPLLFRGLRAKVGVHTGIVFVEGSIRNSQPIGPDEDAEPDDVAYSFRPAFGRSSVQTSDGPAGNRRRASAADALTSPTNGGEGDRFNARSEDDAFYGTVNAKVPLIYGAAVMKSSLLCGTASGGETVVSQQTYYVVSGALDAWGVCARPVTYANSAAAQNVKSCVPVVNDLEYTLFEVGEVAYQLLPVRFLHRAMFFPETGACDVYNATWWLPFNPRSEFSSSRLLQLHGAPTSLVWHGARASPYDSAYFISRINELEQRHTNTKTFVALARDRAMRGVLYRESQERCAMARHDACVSIHWVNLMSNVLLGGNTASGAATTAASTPKLIHRPVEALSLALNTLRQWPSLSGQLHPGGEPTYHEVLLASPGAQSLFRYLSQTLQGADTMTVEALRSHVGVALNDHRVSPNKQRVQHNQGSMAADVYDVDDGTQQRLAPTMLWTLIAFGLAGHAKQLLRLLAAGHTSEAVCCAMTEFKDLAAFVHAQTEGLWQHAESFAEATPFLRDAGFAVLVATGLICRFALSHFRSTSTTEEGGTDAATGLPSTAASSTMHPTSINSGSGVAVVVRLAHDGDTTVSAWNQFVRVDAARMRVLAASVARSCPTQCTLARALSSGFMISPAQWLEKYGTLLVVDPSDLLGEVLADLMASQPNQLLSSSASREVSAASAGALYTSTSPLLGRAHSSLSPTTGAAQQPLGQAAFAALAAREAALFDDKRLENDQRLIRASSVSDFRSCQFARPLTVVEASLETMHHHSTPGAFLGFTVFAEMPEFPFAALSSPHDASSGEETQLATGGAGRRSPALVRRTARDLLHHMAATHVAARRSCRFFLPAIGFMELDQRTRQGSGGPVPTVVVVVPEYSSAVGGCLRLAMSSVDRIQITAATSPQYSLPAAALGMWHSRHVESWGLSIAMALKALHALNASCGFVSPWTVLVPTIATTERDPAVAPSAAGAAYLMENANLLLWKLIASQSAGQDSVAAGESGDTGTATAVHQHPTDLAEWMAPELLAAASGLSEQGDNPTQYIAHLMAATVSGAAYGSVQRGPFDAPIDARALDVWNFGLLMWHLATSGTSPYSILKRTAGTHGIQLTKTVAAPSDGVPPATLTRAHCEHILSLIRVDEATERASFAPGSVATAVSPQTPGLTGGHPLLPPQLSRSPSRQFSLIQSMQLSPTTILLDASQRVDAPLVATSTNTITTCNLFGSVGNLMRHLRLCLETKKARRLAPFDASALWPTTSTDGPSAGGLRHNEGDLGLPEGTEQTAASSAFQRDVDTIGCASFVLLCDLLHRMLQVNPAHRISIDEVLKHPYFLQVPTRVGADGVLDVATPEFVGMTRRPQHPHPVQTRGGGGGANKEGRHQQDVPPTCKHNGIALIDVGLVAPPYGGGSIEPLLKGLFASAIPDRGATLFQVLPADYCLGTPFAVNPLAPPGVALKADPCADASIELQHSQQTGTGGGAAALSAAIGDVKKRSGIALVPVETDIIVQRRIAAAREVARRDALIDRRGDNNGASAEGSSLMPLAQALSSTMAQLLSL